MKKFDWDHAITRKDYALWHVWPVVFVVLVYAALAVWAYWSNIKTWAEEKVKKIKSKLPWCN